MSERDANDVGGASQSHSQTETSLPDPPSRRPTIIRPASKSFAAVSQNEQVPDSLLTSSSAPLTPGTRPPLVKHRSNEKVKPENWKSLLLMPDQ
uniref:Uncharacterized protein n=1 Tax=Arion vulgaris TaxID=1028688 RepID=A0A0B7ANF8_9EUPU